MPAMSMSRVLRHLRVISQAQATRDLSDSELLERFRARREETAFALLVQRHGPMVLGVCQRVLADVHAAEDAFQATFLVLVHKAASIRKQGSVASWLHSVARRIAVKARLRMARDQALGRQLVAMPDIEVRDEWTWHELRAVLDEELEQLPEKYRMPLVLCGLEGKTHEQAACELGCPKSSLSSRLVRARELLRARLTRRGIAVSTAALAALLSEQAAAAVPALLTITTVRAAMQKASEAIPAHVMAMTEEGIKAMGAAKAKAGLVLALMAVAVSAFGYRLAVGGGQHSTEGTKAKTENRQSTGDDRPQKADRYGDPLPAEAIARIGTVRFRHGNDIHVLHFTPDGKEIVSHGFREGTCIWDAATGCELRRIVPEAPTQINTIALSADGRRIAGTLLHRNEFGNKYPVAIWDRMTGKKIGETGNGKYSFPCFAPDSNLLAVIDYDGRIELWDVDAGRSVRSWKAHNGWIGNALFLPDGKHLVTGGSDNAVRFWDVATGDKVRELAELVSTSGSLALSPDGKRLASVVHKPSPPRVIGGERPGNEIQLWDVASGKEVRRLSVPVKDFDPERTFQLAYPTFSHDGKILAATGVDEFLRLWDTDTGKELRRMALGLNSRGRPVFAPDDRTLAVTSHGNAIRLFEAASGKEISPALDAPFVSFMAAITPDGRSIITPDYHRSISIWDLKTTKRTGRLTDYEKPVWSIRLARDGRTLYSSDLSNTIRCWDLADRRELHRFSRDTKAGSTEVSDISPDGKLLAVVDGADGLALVEAATGKEFRRLPLDNQTIFGAAFTPDGRTVIVWNGEHGAMLWDVATGKEQRRIEYRDAPLPRDQAGLPMAVGGPRLNYRAALSPDGRFIAFGSQNRMIALHDVESGKEIRRIEELMDAPFQLAFSPDSRTLAWAGYYDPAVHLLEVSTLRERHRLTGHKGGVMSLMFSQDGGMLVSSGTDATALVWDLSGKLDTLQGALDLDAAWTDLASDNAAKAYQQVRRLSAAPRETVSYLSQHLQPITHPDAKRLAALVADLDSETFARRDMAMKELAKLMELAEPALRKALASEPSPELRRRIEALLDKLHAPVRGAETLRSLRAVEVLEHIATPEARQLLQKLAEGATAARLTREAKAALARLERRRFNR
jgi:RNA polymerase sigma factor (sigma-70 family)